MKLRLLSIILCIPTIMAQVETQSSAYEALQPVALADFVPAEMLVRSHYIVAPTAQPDGRHLIYSLQGPDGTEVITGTQSLAARTSEIKARAALDEMNNSEEFGKALARSGAEKVDSVKEAVKDPLGTVQRLPQGASRLLERVGTAVKNTAEGKGNARSGAAAVLGVSRKKSELAIQLGLKDCIPRVGTHSKLDGQFGFFP
jgi:hypothetical protein